MSDDKVAATFHPGTGPTESLLDRIERAEVERLALHEALADECETDEYWTGCTDDCPEDCMADHRGEE